LSTDRAQKAALSGCVEMVLSITQNEHGAFPIVYLLLASDADGMPRHARERA